jgi:hypothetical protein
MIARQNHLVLEWLSVGLGVGLIVVWAGWIADDALALIDAQEQNAGKTYVHCQDGP